MDNRGVTAVAGKILEIAILLVYVSLLSTALFGSVVPEARTTADATVAERSLVGAVEELRGAIPGSGTGTVTVTVDLPSQIGGHAYTIEPMGEDLVLSHPDEGVGSQLAMLLPQRVTHVTGRWESGGEMILLVTTTDEGVIVRLVTR